MVYHVGTYLDETRCKLPRLSVELAHRSRALRSLRLRCELRGEASPECRSTGEDPHRVSGSGAGRVSKMESGVVLPFVSLRGHAPQGAPTWSRADAEGTTPARSSACLAAETAWHAVWTRSRHEPQVCGELAAKGIEAFLPTITQVSRWSDRTKSIAWPLFPGYCFARFEPDLLSRVSRCTGVVSVLSNAGRPIPIPAAEIEALQRIVASGVQFDRFPQLEPGDRVRVVSGPLAGVTGRLVRRGTKDMLILAVELLNSGARVEVSAWDIARI